jgi:hypothetical protein
LLDQSTSLAAACTWYGATASGDTLRLGTFYIVVPHTLLRKLNGFSISRVDEDLHCLFVSRCGAPKAVLM